MSQTTTNPSVIEQTTKETFPIGINFINEVQANPGTAVTSPVVTLLDWQGNAVSLADEPTVSGTTVTQIVRGPTDFTSLNPNGNTIYTLYCVVTLKSNFIVSAQLSIQIPY